MQEYRDAPKDFVEPTAAELKARNRRNVGIAVALAAFMVFVFVTMISSAQ
ncbi:hypothetical protein DES40_2069 [Litorimonas taeanensis]|uniref:Uncharacterized protein n=1 Tax=Litorimonas taeanensis TaxID=568099 RepID=A0A420WED5_9PROT|nr:hypothetical protein [Litorimonas taeanensis]RKQ69270.1 hypothetical protein DES40_2069 [Litorimonas taeanensis]